jgi:hypothetical protein
MPQQAKEAASGVSKAGQETLWEQAGSQSQRDEGGCQVTVVRALGRGSFVTALLLVAFLLPAGTVQASAARPWWQLDSVSAPANLYSGAAKDEVQEITISSPAIFEMTVGGQFVGVFVTEPYYAEFGGAVPQPTAANVQAALEGAYGAGNVTVTGNGPEGDPPLVVNSVGNDVAESVEAIKVVAFAGGATAKVLTPGRSDGRLTVTASNLGEGEIDGSLAPVILRDRLPAGLVAKSATGNVGFAKGLGEPPPVPCSVTSSGSLVECRFEGKLPPYELLEAEIAVNVSGAQSGESNEVSVSGGGAAGVSLQRPITISDAPTPFGAANYELTSFNENGSLDTQAGSHPYAVTTTLDLNRTDEPPFLPAQPKDLRFSLPPGLVGNPTPFPQCTDAQFTTPGELQGKTIELGMNRCPPDTALGIASITFYERAFYGVITATSPVFNLKPAPGEPARFGFQTAISHVVLDTSVRTGGDYGVTVSSDNITQLPSLLTSRVTFWGVPGDPVHDRSRGWGCLDGFGACDALAQTSPPPFLSLPMSCTGPLQTTVQGDSWTQKGVFTTPLAPPFEPSMDGCNRLPFEPSISVAADTQAASSPSGLTVGIHVPQDLVLNAASLAESTVKDTTVALPAGVALNPAAADGLEACSEAQIALSQDSVPVCPEASKVGTLEIRSPLLPNPLVGAAYLAAQGANPFGSLVALYLVAEDPVSGTLVKLAGEVKPDPMTGQLVSTFKNTPQLPFEDLKLHFFGGSRAPLATPTACGSYRTGASISPWSGNPAAQPSSEFQVVSGPGGGPCSDPLPFSPSLTAGSTNIQAGAFSPFTMTMSREDGQQALQGIQLHMPPGLSGLLTGVKLCGEAEGNAGTCGPESEIGETIVSVGVGGTPFSVKGGRVYITGPYEGAPFGLSIVNPAKAGPYDLEEDTPCDCVVVRAKIEVDPVTAALTITTDNTGPYKIPTILDGIPLQIQHVNVTITRPGFTFNPTNCAPMAITGSLQSTQGASSALSVPFQVTNCATLAFKPGFKVSTAGKTSRANGASLHVKLTYPKAPFGSQANIKSVKVDLPKQLPSNLKTLQKACPHQTFEANPAACSLESRVGEAKATTPLLPVPLTGPAYFVSYGGAKFPELVVVLSGYGVTLDLHGETFINEHTNVTSSTFHTVPDAPVGTFELTLPQGKYSALAAPTPLCGKKLVMPTLFTAQNGATIKQNTPITVTGCPKHRKAAKKTSTKPRGKHRKGSVPRKK